MSVTDNGQTYSHASNFLYILQLKLQFCQSQYLSDLDLINPVMNSSVTNNHGYVLPVVTTFRSFAHSWLITGFVTRVTRRMPQVEQELLIRLEYLSSSPVFSGVRFTRYLALCVLVSFFLLATMLSVLLRFTDSDYPLGIFKLFLSRIGD